MPRAARRARVAGVTAQRIQLVTLFRHAPNLHRPAAAKVIGRASAYPARGRPIDRRGARPAL